ncbi:hypothetical protein I316_00457 [Kwoniella heveanensis BCC8398]|uniref:Major facilitator superfamily (MFS) profile domain-containing protein n=1 Tax=Kwoniella heveanensis BCC8398 TaxID=1296120 RepID=A0A1B9H4N5_9TREE|nr:hypothetical protein I316_00457 [Kwoniella heveanensis BCC8398]
MASRGDDSAANELLLDISMTPSYADRETNGRPPSNEFDDGSNDNDEARTVPVDWTVVIPLFLLRAADAMTYGLIFPFITEYITFLHTPQDKIGLYAGLAEGSLMLTEAVCAPFWAKMADRHGRKRCAIWGFAGIVGSAVLVGFGKSVWWIIFWRAAFGLNPSGVLSRIMITESSHPSNRPFIFSLYSPVFNLGYVSGTLIGGFFASPYGRLPWFLGGRAEIWREWPYGLPCVIVAGFEAITLVICQINLKDIRPRTAGHAGDAPPSVGPQNTEDKIRATLKIPYFALSLTVFCAVFAHFGMLTVMTYTPIELGGWGFSVSSIGIIPSCATLTYIVCTPLVLPRFTHRFSLRTAFIIVFAALPLESLLIPVLQATARAGEAGVEPGRHHTQTVDRSGRSIWFWFVLIAIQLPLYDLHMFGWPIASYWKCNYPGGRVVIPRQLVQGVDERQWAAGRAVDENQKLIQRDSHVLFAAGFRTGLWSHSFWVALLVLDSIRHPLLGRQISWISLFLITLPPLLMSGLLPRSFDELDATLNKRKGVLEEVALLNEASSDSESALELL